MMYRNVKTGLVVTTTGAVRGADWAPVENPAKPARAEASAPPAAGKPGKRAAAK